MVLQHSSVENPYIGMHVIIVKPLIFIIFNISVSPCDSNSSRNENFITVAGYGEKKPVVLEENYSLNFTAAKQVLCCLSDLHNVSEWSVRVVGGYPISNYRSSTNFFCKSFPYTVFFFKDGIFCG